MMPTTTTAIVTRMVIGVPLIDYSYTCMHVYAIVPVSAGTPQSFRKINEISSFVVLVTWQSTCFTQKDITSIVIRNAQICKGQSNKCFPCYATKMQTSIKSSLKLGHVLVEYARAENQPECQ